MFDYAHIGSYIKQVANPFFNNIKLLLRDVHIRISKTSPVGSIVTWTLEKDPEGAAIGRDGYLLECNGQTFDTILYPKLYQVLGTDRVPDYRGYFFRAQQGGYRPGQKVGCSIQSHAHGQPAHKHQVGGTAKGQKYYDMKTGIAIGGPVVVGDNDFRQHCFRTLSHLITIPKNFVYTSFPAATSRTEITSEAGAHAHSAGETGITSTSGAHRHSFTLNCSTHFIVDGGYDYADDSSVSGTAEYSGGDTTHSTGGSETAPMHVYVRYFIRAR